MEERLAEIWREVIGVARVGVHDDFWKVGGDSILGIKLIARARSAGITLSPRQLFERPTIAALAQLAEAQQQQRDLPPLRRRPPATRYPLSADGKLPRAYTELPDPFPLLAAAAAVTKRLKLGTGICLVPERDALMTALQVATVDWISNGRFLFGIGAGWLEEEMRLFTPHFEHRFAYMKEAVAAMRALWGDDGASFDGQWVKFPKVVCRPKPVQQPGPPVLIGGMGPGVLKRVGTWGDGWAPIGVAPDGLAEARADIEKHSRAAGRDPSKLTITAMLGVPPGMEEPALDMLPSRDVLKAYADRMKSGEIDRTAAAAAVEASEWEGRRVPFDQEYGTMEAPALIQPPPVSTPVASETGLPPAAEPWFTIGFKEFREKWIDLGEREYLRRLMVRTNRSSGTAAREAGLERTYLYRLLKKHGV
jgi:probable F420-dependent oxidoreductase